MTDFCEVSMKRGKKLVYSYVSSSIIDVGGSVPHLIEYSNDAVPVLDQVGGQICQRKKKKQRRHCRQQEGHDASHSSSRRVTKLMASIDQQFD